MCQQRDCYASNLYWYTDLEQAKSIFNQYTVKLKGYDNLTTTYGITFEDLGQFLQANAIKY